MSRAQRIEEWLRQNLKPSHLEVLNESHSHNVAANSETHFKVLAVSDVFAGKSLLERHRVILSGLQPEMSQNVAGGLHALSLHLFTPEEWLARQEQAADSPACRGGDGRLPKRH